MTKEKTLKLQKSISVHQNEGMWRTFWRHGNKKLVQKIGKESLHKYSRFEGSSTVHRVAFENNETRSDLFVSQKHDGFDLTGEKGKNNEPGSKKNLYKENHLLPSLKENHHYCSLPPSFTKILSRLIVELLSGLQ